MLYFIQSGNRIVLDGVILDAYGLPFAYWEAKDIDDNLHKAVPAKREAGYPLDNIFFQNPQHGILYQKDKTQIYYNDCFTLVGIPSEVFDYRLGTRSALEVFRT